MSYYRPAPRVRTAVNASAVSHYMTGSCDNGHCAYLGNGYTQDDITKFLIDPTSIPARRQILNNTEIGTCSAHAPAPVYTRDFNTYESTKDLVKSTATEINISGGYDSEAMAVSGFLDYVTKYDTQTKTNVKSSVLNLKYPSDIVNVIEGNGCFGKDNLNVDMIRTFENMEPTDSNYELFIETYGSHVLTHIVYGAKYQEWASSESTDSNTIDSLKASLCASVEGTVPLEPGFSVKGCANYTKEAREAASSKGYHSRRIIMGGSDDARSDLLSGMDKDTLNNFLRSANESTTGIDFGFTPIWDLLWPIYVPSKPQPTTAREATRRHFELQSASAYRRLNDPSAMEQKILGLKNYYQIEYGTWECMSKSNVDKDCQKRSHSNPPTTTDPNRIFHSLQECLGDVCLVSRMQCNPDADSCGLADKCARGCRKNGCHSQADCSQDKLPPSHCEGGGCYMDNLPKPYDNRPYNGASCSCKYNTFSKNECMLGWVGDNDTSC